MTDTRISCTNLREILFSDYESQFKLTQQNNPEGTFRYFRRISQDYRKITLDFLCVFMYNDTYNISA